MSIAYYFKPATFDLSACTNSTDQLQARDRFVPGLGYYVVINALPSYNISNHAGGGIENSSIHISFYFMRTVKTHIVM
jgi:hypothetical protein